MRVLVTAASRYGSTEEIAEAIGRELQAEGLEVSVKRADEVDTLCEFDAVVLGSAVYLGHWLPPAVRLANRVCREIPGRPVWVFSSGPVGDPSRKLVRQMGAEPVDLPAVLNATRARGHRVFAGKLDKHNLRGIQRAALSVVRGLDGDFRDWQDVRQWSETIAGALARETPGDARAVA